MSRAQTQQMLRQLPVKWAMGLLALLVVYALAQPTLNSRLGWNLPSLARLMGESEPKATAQPKPVDDLARSGSKAKSNAANKPDSPTNTTVTQAGPGEPASEPSSTSGSNSKGPTSNKPADKPADKPAGEPAVKPTAKSPRQSADGAASEPTSQSEPKPTSSGPAKRSDASATSTADLLYGILKETSRDRYVSVEGLQYNPGSSEGHRLKHLERHLNDIPDRPGKHGVFDGEMKDVLKIIDDAYARGKRGAKGVRKTEEENRTVYEVPFSQPIGYVGGRDGQRMGHPPAKRLRLVVEGTKFITAFPF